MTDSAIVWQERAARSYAQAQWCHAERIHHAAVLHQRNAASESAIARHAVTYGSVPGDADGIAAMLAIVRAVETQQEEIDRLRAIVRDLANHVARDREENRQRFHHLMLKVGMLEDA